MDNSNELQEIWKSVSLKELPESREMIDLIHNHRNKKLKNFLLLILSSVFFVATMIWVIYTSASFNIIARIGAVLMLISCLILLATNFNSFQRFYNLTACSNKEFLLFLQQTKKRRLFFYKNTQLVLLIFCVTGLFMFLTHLIARNLTLAIAVYAGYSVYFLVMWFYVRPKVYKKGIQKLSRSIEKVERIALQFENNNS